MTRSFISVSVIFAVGLPIMAETVVITSVPDEVHGLDPLTSLAGIPLLAGTEVWVGAFPGLSDDQILDIASQDDFVGIKAVFVPFGDSGAIGQGVDGVDGGFEIAFKDSGSGSPWVGETVSLVIPTENDEFLVARFPGHVFEVESATGLEPLLLLHLSEARIIVGNRLKPTKFSTSPAPFVGSFSTWLAGYPSITDPALKLPGADADSDGRPNFLEYATGGNPSSPVDIPPCWIQNGSGGNLSVYFKRVVGLGTVSYTLESSGTLGPAWPEAAGTIQPDSGDPSLMRMEIPTPLTGEGFFRLHVESAP